MSEKPSNNSVFFDPQTHAAALILGSSDALTRGDAATAFKLADRCCRLASVANVTHLVLRAQALHDLGDIDNAVCDLRRALDIAPEDVLANRRMLEWGPPADRLEAARRLISIESNPVILRAAIAAAMEIAPQAGDSGTVFASIQRNKGGVSGWLAWTGDEAMSIKIRHRAQEQSHAVHASPSHPLAADRLSATDIRITLPDTGADCVVETWLAKTMASMFRLPPIYDAPAVAAAANEAIFPLAVAAPLPELVTIIIPVFNNFEATKACLESVKQQRQLALIPQDVIVINDASPDPKISEYLRSCGLTVLDNAENIGFAGSVNRALRTIKRGDAVLLNSDAVLPSGAIDRLARAACSASDIATVTPLSNNGELTSYPVPYVCNAFPDATATKLLDDLAQKANSGEVIDLLNGIGFCLYIARRCLDVLSELPEFYERGYYEDVHYCLEARSMGLRNVCAADVFVAHQGAQSFGAGKRALVVRNLARLEKVFPECTPETAAFMRADPLLRARARIEAECLKRSGIIAVVAEAGDLPLLQKALADQLSKVTKLVVLVQNGERLLLYIPQAGNLVSSNISFDIWITPERAEFDELIQELNIDKIIITNPCLQSQWLDAFLISVTAPIEILLMRSNCSRHECTRSGVEANSGPGICAPKTPCERWLRHSELARLISGIDDAAAVFATGMNVAAGSNAAKLSGITAPHQRQVEKGSYIDAHQPKVLVPAGTRLGIVLLDHMPASLQLIKVIAAGFADISAASAQIVVLGHTPGDLDLMQLGNVFVTGPVATGDYGMLIRHHGISRLFLASNAPVFGQLEFETLHAMALPLAYIDWNRGQIGVSPGDLALDPAQNDAGLAQRLKSWCGI